MASESEKEDDDKPAEAEVKKITYAALCNQTQMLIDYNKEEFEKKESREEQIEYLLDKHEFRVVPTLDFFEELMKKPEPQPVDFRRQRGESSEDYHARAEEHFCNITEFTITKMYTQGGVHSLSVLSAPSADDNSWGLTNMGKQENVSASQHLFRRVGEMETERVRRSINRLESRDMGSLVWLGASGIGKSVSLIDTLVQLVRKLEHSRYVGFHSQDILTIYKKEQDGTLKKRQKNLDYYRLHDFQPVELKNDFVMLIDPPKIVKDYQGLFCPTLFAVSTCLDTNDLKTLLKLTFVRNLAIDPPSRSEVEAMATCVSAVDNGIKYDNVLKRYETLGANLRIILSGKNDGYETQLTNIQTTKCIDLIQESKK